MAIVGEACLPGRFVDRGIVHDPIYCKPDLAPQDIFIEGDACLERKGLVLTFMNWGSEDPYGIMFDSNGIFLRMSVVPNFKPAPYSVLSWVVKDMPAMIAGLSSRGVKFEVFPGLGQDENGVWAAPDGTKVAWFKDLDGNMLSLTDRREVAD